MTPIAFDFETFLIGPGEILPKAICASFAWRDDRGIMQTALFGNSPVDDLEGNLRKVLESPDHYVITQNGGYDWGVAIASYPALTSLVFAKLIDQGMATDTKWREKLLNLSSTGKLEQMELPDGSYRNISYSLASLVMDYCDRDISAAKEGDDIWRLNYNVLDGWAAEDYPKEAAEYARGDAEDTLLVYEGQEQRRIESEIASTATEEFQLASSFALMLMTAWGMEVNPEAVAKMRVELEAILADTQDLLIEFGLMTPAVPSAPQMRGDKPVLDRKAMEAAGLPIPKGKWEFGAGLEELAEQGIIIKMKAAKKEKMNMKPLQAYARGVFKRIGVQPELSDAGKRAVGDGEDADDQPIKLDAEVQEFLAKHDDVMAQYHRRKSIAKLVQNQLPVLESGPVIYPNYDVLKETGRTSSYGGGKNPLYPATNIQQVPNAIQGFDPRRSYRPREGTVFFDADYTALELACTGQITYDLFGESVHLERYNAGYDLHAYLGSQLAIRSTEGMAGEFAESCRLEGIIGDPNEVYKAFSECKGSCDPEVSKFYKHYRNFAKPVGLGFPGGLGASTMVDFARKTYKVILTEEQATEFKEMWLEIYPEMPEYFKWLNTQVDEFNEGAEKDWKSSKLYHYTTPMGMVRRGASFCAAANGKAMQSPGAEGAKAACINVIRECYDPSMDSVLLGCHPIAFVHDQIIGETTKDESLWHDQAIRVRDIMCDSMSAVLPDIQMRSDEAHLTRLWTKSSEPVFDGAGQLIPWEPK